MAFIGPTAIYQKNKIYAIDQTEKKWALSYTDKFELIKNICKHRQAIIVKDEQDYFDTLSCPLHGWSYNSGKLIGEPAGFFDTEQCLEKKEVYDHDGLLFTQDPQIDFSSIPMKDIWHPSKYVYTNTTVMNLPYKWEYFIEAVLDSYHISYMHPGLSNFCDINSYFQQTGNGWAFQTTNLYSKFKKNPSEIYTNWQDHIQQNYSGRWTVASIWLVIFPNIMIEYYPGTCLVSSVWPNGDNACKFILHHYYEDDIVAFDPEFIKLEQARYMESAIEDDDLSIRIQQGRTSLSECYTHPLESQIKDFYEQTQYHHFIKF
jgi:choline monooxygenase